jgi:hypothetical protein
MFLILNVQDVAGWLGLKAAILEVQTGALLP